MVARDNQLRARDLPVRIRTSAGLKRESDGSDGPTALTQPSSSGFNAPPLATLAKIEEIAIRRTIEHTGGNLSEACRVLGIGRTTLYRKIKGYGIETQHH